MKFDVKYGGEQKQVIKWLHTNIQYDYLSPSGRSGFDTNFRLVFGVFKSKPVVSFKREKDAMLFALRWA